MANLQERGELLAKANDNPKLQALLMAQCRDNPVYWFNNFCYTFDPRREPSTLPFNLYQVQEWFVLTLIRYMEKQEDFGLEKSRDVGASWLIALTFQYCWLFREGWNFHIGSRKEEYVDKKGDISTLFEKERFNLNYLPSWMLPNGFNFDKHCLYMRLINPQNGNTITGESSNPNFARGGRYRAILFDEFPVWDHGYPAWTSASQSTKCRIPIGTPNGKHNKHGQLMTDPKTKRIIWPGRNETLKAKGMVA